MPAKKTPPSRFGPVDEELDGQLGLWADAVRDGDSADWTALDTYELGSLVRALCASDSGVMLRSAEKGQSVAVGLFVGGKSQWTTCRQQNELLAVLHAALELLEHRVSVQGTGVPVPPTPKTPRKRSSASA